jgi:hypothetical protein
MAEGAPPFFAPFAKGVGVYGADFDSSFQWVPLDKSEGVVKGTLVLGGA